MKNEKKEVIPATRVGFLLPTCSGGQSAEDRRIGDELPGVHPSSLGAGCTGRKICTRGALGVHPGCIIYIYGIIGAWNSQLHEDTIFH